ncbi:MAG: hypothetical protein QJR00_00540 [Bacillota bacterium]|nr:hypothetical protein [Bacillota bacterium]
MAAQGVTSAHALFWWWVAALAAMGGLIWWWATTQHQRRTSLPQSFRPAEKEDDPSDPEREGQP